MLTRRRLLRSGAAAGLAWSWPACASAPPAPFPVHFRKTESLRKPARSAGTGPRRIHGRTGSRRHHRALEPVAGHRNDPARPRISRIDAPAGALQGNRNGRLRRRIRPHPERLRRLAWRAGSRNWATSAARASSFSRMAACATKLPARVDGSLQLSGGPLEASHGVANNSPNSSRSKRRWSPSPRPLFRDVTAEMFGPTRIVRGPASARRAVLARAARFGVRDRRVRQQRNRRRRHRWRWPGRSLRLPAGWASEPAVQAGRGRPHGRHHRAMGRCRTGRLHGGAVCRSAQLGPPGSGGALDRGAAPVSERWRNIAP